MRLTKQFYTWTEIFLSSSGVIRVLLLTDDANIDFSLQEKMCHIPLLLYHHDLWFLAFIQRLKNISHSRYLLTVCGCLCCSWFLQNISRSQTRVFLFVASFKQGVKKTDGRCFAFLFFIQIISIFIFLFPVITIITKYKIKIDIQKKLNLIK